jgi:hypothetical protein
MPTPISLIQLVSEQTMQNLLPVLRLKPARLIHLATPRTADRSARIAEAARRSQCSVEFQTIDLPGMPSITETHQAVRMVIEEEKNAGRSPVVNFTGGTKLMSIGAYAAALKDRVPSLYVDTQDSVFVDGRTAPGLDDALDGDYSFTPILRSLTVHVVACANGCARVTGGRDWRPFLPLAEHLLNSPEEEKATHQAFHGPDAPFAGGREPRKPGDWLPYFDHEFSLPERVKCLALEAGLMEPGAEAATVRLPQKSRSDLKYLASNKVADYHQRYFTAIAPVQQAISLLAGGWWEVIVADRALRSGRFRDLRWSVQVGEKGGADLEEDIVALDGVQIAYISCKRGGNKARLLPLLEEINARARTLGGAFNRRYLAIWNPPSGKVLRDLQTRAGALGIRLLFPHHFEQPDPFA